MQCSVQEVREKQGEAKHELQTLTEQKSLFIFISMCFFHFFLSLTALAPFASFDLPNSLSLGSTPRVWPSS